MLERTSATSVTMEDLQPDTTYSYIVQPLSYTCIGDNVSPEYSVTATTLPGEAAAETEANMTTGAYGGMPYWLYTPASLRSTRTLCAGSMPASWATSPPMC